ncbi:MAG: TerC family protein [Candidatus Electronema sp. V4]|uniref:TerC family protein n=1 Tax=Candidatus Electronema sp. V4 TaxID=3454756 RepID=UPI0040558D71
MALLPWFLFILLILSLLFLDLGVFHKQNKVISAKEALLWTMFWVVLALLFNVFIFYAYSRNWLGIGLGEHALKSGKDAALKFFTGYIIEKSLSLDNIFVIAMIFSYFKVEGKYQHRVLFWGILGALVMRGAMILAGTALIQAFDWMIYVFGGFLILTAGKMLFSGDEEIEPEKNILIRVARKLFPVSPNFEGEKFFTVLNGRKAVTPMFLVLLIVESTDVLFAVDSIPAIFAVTTDPFIVFTSNVFAILGLRSLYFALAAMIDQFRYLKLSLVVVLAYVGVKMIVSHHYPIPTGLSLGLIAGILCAGVIASLLASRREEKAERSA